MNIVNQLNFHRLGRFITSDLYINKSKIYSYALSLIAILILTGLIAPYDLQTGNFHPTIFKVLLFFGGCWFASKAFNDFHDKTKAILVLTLPITNFERFLGRMLLTWLGYLVALIVIFYLASVIVSGFSILVYHVPTVLFNIAAPEVMRTICAYLLLQPLFLVGAIYFRRHAFSKTVMLISAFVIGSYILIYLVGFIFAPIYGLVEISTYFMLDLQGILLYLTISLLLLPCCWVLIYLRICESEV